MIEAYYNFNTSFTLNLKFIESRNQLTSDFFKQNDYNIHSFYLEPKFTYNWKTNIRTSISYGFANKKNSTDLGGEKAITNKNGFRTALQQSI